MNCGASVALLVVEKHRQVEHMAQLVAMGIDEEQATSEHRDELLDHLASAAAATDRSRTPTAAQQHRKHTMAPPPALPSFAMTSDTTQAQQRPRAPRSSSRLAQLPRLDSMRNNALLSAKTAESHASAGPLDSVADTSSSSSSTGGNDNDDEVATMSDDDDDETTDGQETTETDDTTDDFSDLSSSDGSDEDGDGGGSSSMPGFLPTPSAGRRSSSISSEAVSDISGRNSRRPSAIVLPPAPTFTDLSKSTPLASRNDPPAHSTSTAQSFSPPTPVAFGRESWTQFGADEYTPGWLPTPRAVEPSASTVPSRVAKQTSTTSLRGSQARTPTGRVADPPGMSPTSTFVAPQETSYFAIQPAPAQNVARASTNDKNAPPPSPSIISRARARSSASMRPFGTTPTIPMRDLPVFPPVTPLQLRASERAKSPARNSGKLSITPTTLPLVVPAPTGSNAPEASTSASAVSLLTSEANDLPPRPATAVTPTSAGALHLSPLPTPSRADTIVAKPSLRPSLYKQQSRSLIDLTSTNERRPFEPSLKPFKPEARIPQNIAEGASPATPTVPLTAAGAAPPRAASPAPSFSSVVPTGLQRRRSMFEVGAAPPPYSDIHGALKAMHILPREEEGREELPDYGCSVHIEGYLPRKMEFSSPGVQAKDRSWRRQYFVLHGTCLRVFRTDLSRENATSKGDFGFMDGAHVHKEPMNEDGPTPLPGPGSERPSRLHAVDRNGREVGDKDSYATIAPPSSGTTSSSTSIHASTNSSTMSTTGSSSGGGLQRKVEDALSGTISHINHPFSLHKGALVKQYTLQGAESGLAADYLKRRHVVRIRAEGEQFLLQTRNDRHVVDWIEAFQAGTNIAMDLEGRPMPKFITLPRRRRRRRREDQATTAGGTAAPADAALEGLSAREQAELSEARRRSLADVQGSRRSSAHSRGGDSPPDPSAAFDAMLREEHENMARQEAADM